MILNTGDWSEDGHGKNIKTTYNVNHTIKEVQEAYKASCNSTKVSFNHNEDYTNSGRDYKESTKYHICTEYGDNILKEEVFDILVNFIGEGVLMTYLDDWDGDFYIADFEGLWWEFVKITLKDLVYEEIYDNTPEINSYGDFNHQFGYGLFE